MVDRKDEGVPTRQILYTHSLQEVEIYGEHLENALRLAQRSSKGRHLHKRLDKVPPDMRQANTSDYEPIYFRIGLYNARFEIKSQCNIAPCDYYKIEIARALTTEDSFEQLLALLVARMGDIRKLYSAHRENDEFRGERPLALILALDALTVVAAACYPECVTPRSMCPVIWRDAFLLEQQLPLFVIQAALDSIAFDAAPGSPCACADSAVVTIAGSSHVQSIDDVVNFYALQTFYPFLRDVEEQRKRSHLPVEAALDMEQSLLRRIHTSLIHDGSVRRKCVVSDQFTSLPTASKLQTYGIRFAVGDGGFTGMKFDRKSRVLTLPEITVFSTTKCYLLNLVAQEVAISSYDDDPSPVSSYILMMDFLIDVEEDVRVLVDAQVVYSHLGSLAELAVMWNSLGVNLPISLTREDSRLINAVREACHERHRFQHGLRNKFPLRLLTFVLAAVFLLALVSN